jgi:hypothetical protein
MAVTATRATSITFAGDEQASLSFSAANNSVSPGAISVLTLSAGFNTITLPTGGTTPVAATIVPPPGNTQTMVLKGVTGDTGIQLHKTDPSTVTFDNPPPVSFGITAGGTITGLRVVWS